jgi:hypothetical protein
MHKNCSWAPCNKCKQVPFSNEMSINQGRLVIRSNTKEVKVNQPIDTYNNDDLLKVINMVSSTVVKKNMLIELKRRGVNIDKHEWAHLLNIK